MLSKSQCDLNLYLKTGILFFFLYENFSKVEKVKIVAPFLLQERFYPFPSRSAEESFQEQNVKAEPQAQIPKSDTLGVPCQNLPGAVFGNFDWLEGWWHFHVCATQCTFWYNGQARYFIACLFGNICLCTFFTFSSTLKACLEDTYKA